MLSRGSKVEKRIKINDPADIIYKRKAYILPIVFVVRLYQYIISPFLGYNCRFTPTCSEYSIKSFEKYGLIKGAFYSLKRILRCNPWNDGGYDPLV